jgi:hypothetical protein
MLFFLLEDGCALVASVGAGLLSQVDELRGAAALLFCSHEEEFETKERGFIFNYKNWGALEDTPD